MLIPWAHSWQAIVLAHVLLLTFAKYLLIERNQKKNIIHYPTFAQ